MATITKGKTFGATEEVTNVKLHQLVDSATIASIVSADHDLASTQPIHVGTSAPSDTTQRGWYDTSNNVFRVKDSGNVYQPVSGAQFFTNKSGGSLAAGDVVIIDTANDSAVTTTTTANNTAVMGVVLIGGADEAEVAIVTEGYCPAVTVTGSTDNGDYLFTSTTVKKADSNSSHGSGAFAKALTTSSTSVEALIGGAAVAAAIGGARFNAVGVINSTRDVSAATGAVNYAHGLGQKPVELRVHYGYDGINGASCSGTCISIDGGSTFTQACNYFQDAASAQKPAVDSTAFMKFLGNSGADDCDGVVTGWDATNVTITWTKSGTPTGELRFVIVATA